MFKPLHSPKTHNLYNRKLHKMLQRSGWVSESEVVVKSKWRHKIPREWSGDKPLQFSVPGMKYTSVMSVPSTKDGRLIKMLARAEPRIAKVTKYQVKYAEKSGRQLSKFFPKEL